MDVFTCKEATYKIFNYIFTLLSFSATFAAAVLGSLNRSASEGTFRQDVENITHKYYLEVMPCKNVFVIIWSIIYVWTTIAKSYLCISLFFPSNLSPVKSNLPLVGIEFLFWDTIAFAGIIGWYFQFDREKLELALCFLGLSVVGIYLAIVDSLRRMANHSENGESKQVTLWLIRILVQNGTFLFATWTTIITIMTSALVLRYHGDAGVSTSVEKYFLSDNTASSMMMGISLSVMVLWFILEYFLLEKYTRYIFTVYPVFMVTFVGIFFKLESTPGTSTTSQIFGSVNLGMAVLLFFAKMCLFLHRYYSCKMEEVFTNKLAAK